MSSCIYDLKLVRWCSTAHFSTGEISPTITSHFRRFLAQQFLWRTLATCTLAALVLSSCALQRVESDSPIGIANWKQRIGPVVPFGELRSVGGLEGLAISPQNDVYAAAQDERVIYRITPDARVSVFADFGFKEKDITLTGLVVATDGTVYAAVVGCARPELNGVWRADATGRPSHAYPMPTPNGKCNASVPNALAFDESGNLYVTESAQGEVWRLRAGRAELWSRHELFRPRPESTNQVGIDGIAFRNNSLWVNNLDTGTIVEIPIKPDGQAGIPRLFAQGLGHPDGHQFDVEGNLWVTNLGYEEWDKWTGATANILRVSPDGKVDIAITTSQLSGSNLVPSSPVFGFGRESSTLFLGGWPLDPKNPRPNVLKVDVGISGMRLPQFRPSKDKP